MHRQKRRKFLLAGSQSSGAEINKDFLISQPVEFFLQFSSDALFFLLAFCAHVPFQRCLPLALRIARPCFKLGLGQKQWALRRPSLDAHCLALQKEILRLEQEIDELVMAKLN